MKQVYYSDITKNYYDTEEEATKAEEKVLALREEKKLRETKRAEMAKNVEEAYKYAREAREKADGLLKDFCKEYGAFHTTVKEPFVGWFDGFFDNFFDCWNKFLEG